MEERNSKKDPSTDRIKLNVGGKHFVTTAATLRSGGPDSLLSALSRRPSGQSPIFIDRDPDIFSVLLSLLRSNRLPSAALRFSKHELATEALYYGLDHRLHSAASPPPFSGIDASIAAAIKPSCEGLTTAISASAADGSVWLAHSGQISSYDVHLLRSATIRTHLDEISALGRLSRSSEIAALGSDSAAGLHFYDLSGGRNLGSVQWRDPSDPRIYKARVAAVADSPDSESDSVFAAFHCPHRENSVLAIDKSTLQVQAEIGRQSGSSAKNLVPGKLTWLPERGLLFGASVTCGAFGFSGYVRLWDPRSGHVAWESNEPGSGRSGRFGDPLADVAVDPDESMIFKVCSKSGDLGMADIRKLSDDPWVYLKEQSPKQGVILNTVIQCHKKKQVLVAREGSLEVWSTVPRGSMGSGDESLAYRKNFVDKAEDCERGVIERVECGGERLFVCRRDSQGVEVWETSNSSPILDDGSVL